MPEVQQHRLLPMGTQRCQLIPQHGKTREPAGAQQLRWRPTRPTSKTGAEGDVLHPHSCVLLVLLQPRPGKGDHGMRDFLPSVEKENL